MSLLQRLQEIHELPTLPEIALKIRELITSDDGDASSLASIIEQDPSLSAKVLKVANSSFYCSLNSRITSVKYAVARIGFNEIGNLAMAVSFIKQFSRKSALLDYKKFWRHSLTSAYLTSLVASVNNSAFPGQLRQKLFLSGLFHDIGLLVFDQFFHPQLKQIITLADAEQMSYIDSEKKLFPGETHADLGSTLLELWKIDLHIINGIRFHHNPENAPEEFRSVASAVYLSEYVLFNSGPGSFEGVVDIDNNASVEALHFKADMLKEYLDIAEKEIRRSDLLQFLED